MARRNRKRSDRSKSKKGCYQRRRKSRGSVDRNLDNFDSFRRDNSVNGFNNTPYSNDIKDFNNSSSNFQNNSFTEKVQNFSANHYNNDIKTPDQVSERFVEQFVDKNNRRDINNINGSVVQNNSYQGNASINNISLDPTAPVTPIPLPYSSNYETNKRVEMKSPSSHSSTSYSYYSSTSSKNSKNSHGVVELNDVQVYNKQLVSANVKSGKSSQVVIDKSFKDKHFQSASAIPVLNTNKVYNISFALDQRADFVDNRVEWTGANQYEDKQVVATTQIEDRNLERQGGHHRRRKHRRSNKKLQTYEIKEKQKAHSDFEGLLKDVHFETTERKERMDGGNMIAGSGIAGASAVGASASAASAGGGAYASYSSAMAMSNGNLDADTYYANESTKSKHWILIEQPDGRQERREFKKEMNSDGDVKYIDVQDKKTLKTEMASWKSGEEWVRDGKKSRRIKYEWRKDNATGEWTKYNADTNEVLKRGDWKTGSEWYRNSRGKYAERSYVFIQKPDKTWVKTERGSGKVIDFGQSSANKGHDWRKHKGKTCGKNKDPRWHRVDYEYVQDQKGRWFKRDLETNKKIGKLGKHGWKKGTDYHMDDIGKVKKVKYEWQPQSDGALKQMIVKDRKPINNSWKEGNEVIMDNNVINRHDFAWVKAGRNKWIKINQESGRPLSNKIKANKILSSKTDFSQRKSILAKTSRQIGSDQIVQESTQVQQGRDGIVKSTTKFTKPIDKYY